MAPPSPRPTRVAIVCMGNICRSPMAEAVVAAMVEEAGLSKKVSVESFGTVGFHIGEPAYPQAVAALRRRGWKPTDHRARKLGRHDVESADLLLCADRANLAEVRRMAGNGMAEKVRLLRDYDPASAPPDNEVPDPWGGPDAGFDAALTLIERACRGLVAELAREAV